MSIIEIPRIALPDFAFPGAKPVGAVDIDHLHPVAQRLQVLHLPVGNVDVFYQHGITARRAPTISTGTYTLNPTHSGMSAQTSATSTAVYWAVGTGIRPAANVMTMWLDYIPLSSASSASFVWGDVQQSSTGYNWGIYQNTSNVLFGFIKNSGGTGVAATGPTMTIGNRYRVAVTYDGANVHIAVNGRYYGSASQTGDVAISDTFAFGFNHWGPSNKTVRMQVLSAGMSITKLPLGQFVSLSADPYQILIPANNPMRLVYSAGGATSLVLSDLTQSQSIDNVTLTQSHVLAVNALDQAQSLDNLTLVQANVLSVAEIGQAQSLDNVTLTQAHIIAVNDLSQGQTLDNLTLTQANVLAVADLTQAQLIDALTLVQHNIISPNALDQAQGIDNVTLTVAGSLAVQALLQGQTIDNLTLTQAGTLSVADLTQAQLLDAAALTQHYVLAVADLLQSQILDNVTLSLSGATLSVADLGQAQLLDAPGLVQHAVIAVQDLTQQQILDIATLGGLVIGELQGTIVVYALVGGAVRCYSALDGTITLH